MSIYRIVWNILAVIGALSIVSALFFWHLEGEFDLASGIEESRLESPNAEYDAVIIKYEPMAFSTPRYELFIVPHGEKYSESSTHFQYSKFNGTGLEIEDVSWRSNLNLVIKRWSRSRVYNFIPEYHDLEKSIERDTHTDYQKVYIDLITSELNGN